LDISADGIGPSMIGFPYTKITFCQQRVVGAKDAPLKEVVAIVNIPTNVLLDFAATI
jgi:hypothetical protein